MAVKLEDTIYLHFATQRADTGAATNADSTPTVTVEEDGVALGYSPTVTNITTGIYRATLACTTANGFEAGKRYSVYVAATVNSIDGNAWLGEFGVFNTLYDDLAEPGDAMDLVANAVDAAAIATDAIDADAIAASAITATEAPLLANLDAAITTRAAPGDDMGLTAAGVDDVWDEVLTPHNVAASAAVYLKGFNVFTMHSGTATGGGATYIDLDAGASATNQLYEGELILIHGGTGAGQSRLIVKYVGGGTKRAYVQRPWITNPNAASEFAIVGLSAPLRTHDGQAQAGGATSITLDTTASAVDNTYTGEKVVIHGGTGEGQARIITAYNGTTKVATVAAWQTQPDNTSIYAIYPTGRSLVTHIESSVLTEIQSQILSDATAFAGADVAAIKAKTDNLPSGIQKNTARSNFEFVMYDSSDHITPVAGLTVSGQVSIDGGAFGALTNAVSGVANGLYKVDLAAADLNGDVVTLYFTATGGDPRFITIMTEP